MGGGRHNQNVQIVERLRDILCPPTQFHSGGFARRANTLRESGIGKQGSTNHAELHVLPIWNRNCEAKKIEVPLFRSDTP